MDRFDSQAVHGIPPPPHAEGRPDVPDRRLQSIPSARTAITVYPSLESAEALRREWDGLLEEYPGTTPFCTWEWLASWWRAYAKDDQLLVLAVRDASSALIGLAPLALSTRRVCGVRLRELRLMGDGSHDSDNLDLPVRPGREAEFSQALLDWIGQHAREWDVCRLCTLPVNSPMAGRLPGDLQARGWRAHTSGSPQSVLDLPASWDAYLKGLSKNERGKVGVRMRRVERRYQVRFRKCEDASELEPALETLFNLHTLHWQRRGKPGSFRSPARRRLYQEVAPLLLARGRLEFWLLVLDGSAVAAQFAMRHGNTVYALQEGFDPEYSADSVGYVLRSHVLKALIERGVRSYDFLGGAAESKTRWGARVGQYLDIVFARRRSAGSLVLWLERATAGVKGWLRRKLPDAALRTLNRLARNNGNG